MKNKIFKYDFLIVGAGLIGSLTALALNKKKLKVLAIDGKNFIPKDSIQDLQNESKSKLKYAYFNPQKHNVYLKPQDQSLPLDLSLIHI